MNAISANDTGMSKTPIMALYGEWNALFEYLNADGSSLPQDKFDAECDRRIAMEDRALKMQPITAADVFAKILILTNHGLHELQNPAYCPQFWAEAEEEVKGRARAEMRLAEEYDAAQDRGEVQKAGGDRTSIVSQGNNAPTASDLGLAKDAFEETDRMLYRLFGLTTMLHEVATEYRGLANPDPLAHGILTTICAIRDDAEAATKLHEAEWRAQYPRKE